MKIIQTKLMSTISQTNWNYFLITNTLLGSHLFRIKTPKWTRQLRYFFPSIRRTSSFRVVSQNNVNSFFSNEQPSPKFYFAADEENELQISRKIDIMWRFQLCQNFFVTHRNVHHTNGNHIVEFFACSNASNMKHLSILKSIEIILCFI